MESIDPLLSEPDLDLWQQDLHAEELPDAASATGTFSTFATVSSLGPCIGTASCVGSLSC